MEGRENFRAREYADRPAQAVLVQRPRPMSRVWVVLGLSRNGSPGGQIRIESSDEPIDCATDARIVRGNAEFSKQRQAHRGREH